MTDTTASTVRGTALVFFYAVIVVVALPPAWYWLARPTANILDSGFVSALLSELRMVYRDWFVWAWAGILMSGQVMLLVLSANTSWWRARPHRHRTGLVLTVALQASLLTVAGFWSLPFTVIEVLRAVGVPENVIESVFRPVFAISPMNRLIPGTYFDHLTWWLGLWAIWAGALYLHARGASLQLAAAVSWLFKGSVLALLLAASARVSMVVSSHWWLFVDAFSAFYIVTAAGVMLLCFGSSLHARWRN